MIVAYGVANFLQAVAANREHAPKSLSPWLLFRLATHKTYVTGIACQVIGFILAILARADLPLFLVQGAVAAGLGVTAILGVVILKWRMPRAEIALLIGLSLGIVALIVSAQPSVSKDLGPHATLGLAASTVVIGALGFLVARFMRGVPSSVTLGGLAGLAFGAAAVVSRPLAGTAEFTQLLANPLLYLIIVQSLTAQLLLAMAMQRGSTTAAVASMDAAFAAPPAALGLLLLGDKVRPGFGWIAGAGFAVTLITVLLLTRYAGSQDNVRPPRRSNGSTDGCTVDFVAVQPDSGDDNFAASHAISPLHLREPRGYAVGTADSPSSR